MTIKNIIFDFDGVILDSIPVKTNAFRELFSSHPKDLVELFIEYHLQNGGFSRYKKIQYFYEYLLNAEISEKEILCYAHLYSSSTKEILANKKYLICDTIDFIKKNYETYNMHIASGADEQDLLYICRNLSIDSYFLTINGSPATKAEIIHDLLKSYRYNTDETCLIGDSINDLKAAEYNGIHFLDIIVVN